MGLVTLDECAQWLGVDLTGDSRSTALLTRFIATATTKVETWCRRSFESGSVIAEPHTVDASGSVYLNRVPVSIVTLVNIVLSDETLQPIADTSYDVNAQTGQLRIRLSLWGESSTEGPFLTRDAQVSYTGGEAVCPDQVKEATIHVVSMLWYGKGRDAAAVNQSAGSFSKTLGVDRPSGLPESAVTLLLDYRRLLGALV